MKRKLDDGIAFFVPLATGREIGVHRILWYLPPAPRDEVAPRVERYAARVREVEGS